MRHHDDLRVFRRRKNQPRQRRQQIRMQARLRLVQHHQLRRSRRQQRRCPQQIPQRSIRQLRAVSGRSSPCCRSLKLKASVLQPPHTTGFPGNASSIVVASASSVANLDNRLQRGRKIAPIVMQHRRERADLRQPRRRRRVGAKAVVEPPSRAPPREPPASPAPAAGPPRWPTCCRYRSGAASASPALHPSSWKATRSCSCGPPAPQTSGRSSHARCTHA